MQIGPFKLENALALANALGGSTNAVLHLLAIANEVGKKSGSGNAAKGPIRKVDRICWHSTSRSR